MGRRTGSAGATSRASGEPTGEGDVEAGQALYNELPGDTANSCAECHGNLETNDFHQLVDKVPERTDQELYDIIADGIGYMPALGGDLSEQNITDIVAFLRATFPE